MGEFQQASINNAQSGWLKTLRGSGELEKSFEKSKTHIDEDEDLELVTESVDDDSAESPVFAWSKPSEHGHVRSPFPVTMIVQAPVVEQASSSREEVKAATKVEYLYGSSHDEKWETRAWRASVIDGQPGSKEFTTKLEFPAIKSGEDEHEVYVVARWPDGHKATIKSLPYALLTARAAKLKAHEEAAATKVLKTSPIKEQYTIKHKSDRNPLWVLT